MCVNTAGPSYNIGVENENPLFLNGNSKRVVINLRDEFNDKNEAFLELWQPMISEAMGGTNFPKKKLRLEILTIVFVNLENLARGTVQDISSFEGT